MGAADRFGKILCLTNFWEYVILYISSKEDPPLDEAAADKNPKWPHLPTPGLAMTGLFFPYNAP